MIGGFRRNISSGGKVQCKKIFEIVDKEHVPV